MKKITSTELKELVIKEATNLKKYATITEIRNLNWTTVDAFDGDKCIYGQMTGNCFDDRADALIKLCCEQAIKPRHTRNGLGYDIVASDEIFENPNENTHNRLNNGLAYYSPIEVFIANDINTINGNIRRLIAFLKDETPTLELV